MRFTLLIFLSCVTARVANAWSDRRKEGGEFKGEQRHLKFILEKLGGWGWFWTSCRNVGCCPLHPHPSTAATSTVAGGTWGEQVFPGRVSRRPPIPLLSGLSPDQSLCCSEPCDIKVGQTCTFSALRAKTKETRIWPERLSYAKNKRKEAMASTSRPVKWISQRNGILGGRGKKFKRGKCWAGLEGVLAISFWLA